MVAPVRLIVNVPVSAPASAAELSVAATVTSGVTTWRITPDCEPPGLDSAAGATMNSASTTVPAMIALPLEVAEPIGISSTPLSIWAAGPKPHDFVHSPWPMISIPTGQDSLYGRLLPK